MMEVYHYTSKESMERIQRSGYIRESPLSDRDAFYGAGVYLTTLTPEEGRRRIANNNWGAYGPYMEEQGKVEGAIKLWIPEHKLQRARSGDRDIWVHKGDIRLGAYRYTPIHLDQQGWWWWCNIL